MADITVIGGINIDIEGSPFNKLRREDSNPGRISLSYGGVGRNITENIARIGGDVAMVSVIGEDQMGRGAKEELQELGVDVSGVEILAGRNSAMYLSILNEDKDMELAISDPNYKSWLSELFVITPRFLDKHRELLLGSKAVALDTNLSEETLEYAADILEKTPLFLDPVSVTKAVKARKIIGKFECIKPNVMEAEALSGLKITSEEELRAAGGWFIQQGVKKVFITLNKEGVYYRSPDREGFIRPKDISPVSATGAGDSFSAAILIGMVRGLDIEEIAKIGMAAAQGTMESPGAVNKAISKAEIERRF